MNILRFALSKNAASILSVERAPAFNSIFFDSIFSPALRLALSIAFVATAWPAMTTAQSGAIGARAGTRTYGVNLTFALYQFDAARSPELQEVTRLSGTFSTAAEEIAHLKDKYKLEEVEARHVRSVGLRGGETFNDAVLLGPEYMVFVVTARDVVRGFMKLDLQARYANETLLNVKGVEMENYETVMLRGGRGTFGVKYYIGAGGRQESAPVERTLLLSVTPEIVPLASLRNRPQELSHPVDENGSPIDMKESDLFTPPVALDRVVPKFEAGRAVRGSALLGGMVTPEGKIINVRVLRSIEAAIDQRAIEAFRQYRFSPALLNGKPVYATYREEIVFAPPQPSLNDILQEAQKQREKEKKEKEEKEKQKRKKPDSMLFKPISNACETGLRRRL